VNRDSESAGAPADQHVLCRQEIARLKVEYGRVLVLENDAAADRDRGRATIARLRLALIGCIQPCHECGAADIARTALDRADWCGHAIDPVEGVCLVCGEA